MPYREFLEWMEFYGEEPFLADRLEIQLAKIGQTNLLTAMGKIDLEADFFFVSNQNKKEKLSKHDRLANELENYFK